MKKKILFLLILLMQVDHLYSQPTYFGYYHIDGTPFYTGEYLSKYGNMDYVNCGVFCTTPMYASGTDVYTKSRSLFDIARSKNIKLWIQVYDAFFFWPGGGQNGNGSAYIFSDWQTRWNNVKQCISGYEDIILGFYFDEPFWHGVTEANFRSVTSTIRTDLPNMKILTVECGIPIKPSVFGLSSPSLASTYFDFCTDLGFDIYDRNWDSGDYNTLFTELKSKATKNQALWTVASGALEFQDAYTVADNLLKWYQLGVWDNRVVGNLVYTLSSSYGAVGSDSLINSNSYYKTMHMAVGREISWANPVYKNLWNAQLDFTGTQGSNNWYYQYWDGSQFVNMTFNNPGQYWESPGTLAKIYTTALFPDVNKETTLVWVAPKTGYIRVNLRPRKPSWSTCGDGAYGGVYKNQVLQQNFDINGNNTTGTATQLLISVNTNDRIEFRVNRRNNSDCDNVTMNPTISFTY